MYNRTHVTEQFSGREIFSLTEAAAFAGIGLTTLRRLIKQGKIKHRKVGKRVLVRRVDVIEYMDPVHNDHH